VTQTSFGSNRYYINPLRPIELQADNHLPGFIALVGINQNLQLSRRQALTSFWLNIACGFGIYSALN
jgi:hypothetical protein